MRTVFAVLLLTLGLPAPAAGPDDAARAARERWRASSHGEMLERIIPPYLEPSRLPEPRSAGARLTARYCTQCHHLANPAMHEAAKWPAIVQRMLPRMRGRGNLGTVMRDLMDGLESPGDAEVAVLVAYLQKHAQVRALADALPEAGRSDGWASFTRACAQCHALPDPRRHTRAEWPGVVARMERNMAWMNRVVGSQADPREPRYRVEDIIAYLRRHARP